MLDKDRGMAGRNVCISTLFNEGWKKVCYFGHDGLLLSKGERRIIYSFKSKSVIIEYKSKPILGC